MSVFCMKFFSDRELRVAKNPKLLAADFDDAAENIYAAAMACALVAAGSNRAAQAVRCADLHGSFATFDPDDIEPEFIVFRPDRKVAEHALEKLRDTLLCRDHATVDDGDIWQEAWPLTARAVNAGAQLFRSIANGTGGTNESKAYFDQLLYKAVGSEWSLDSN
jgi:hypothetical protein